MMKRLTFLVLLCTAVSIASLAQDAHLTRMAQGVAGLRKAKTEARNRLVAEWSAGQMPKVTLLDNLGTSAGEARGKGCNPFMVNQVVTYVHNRQNTGMVSKGDYFNSTEKDVHYSAIEKTVQPRQTVTYSLTGHIGHQQFMFVAYDPKAKLTFRVGGKLATDRGNGVAFVDLGAVSRQDAIAITVTNDTDKAQSFVILNHNPQRR